MSILSWLGFRQRFMRRSAVDEFDAFVREERARRRGADGHFDEVQFDRAVDVVRRHLGRQVAGRRDRS